MADTAFWPSNVRFVKDAGDEKEAADKIYAEHAEAWRRKRNLYKLYVDHLPDMLEKLRRCRTLVRTRPGEGKAGSVAIVERVGCGVRPYCPACNEEQRVKRARNAVRVLESASPGREKPRAFGVTFAARMHTTHPEWQGRAMEDHRALMRGVARGLDRAYGGGVGCLATFQAYGNDVFTQPHPHVHVIMSSWKLVDETPARVQPLDLDSWPGARERAFRPIVEGVARALKCDVDARTTNTWITREVVGKASIRAAYRYNFRELLNPLDWFYDRDAQTIRIMNYPRPIASRTISAMTLRPRVEAYGARYGDWNDIGQEGPSRGRRTLDGWYGILSDKLLPETRIVMSHTAQHSDDCACRECTEYERADWQPDWAERPIDPIARPF
jgi:hypothetical protein